MTLRYKMECDRCGVVSKRVHNTGYHRSADAKAGDPMTTLAYLCEDCIEEVFGEFMDVTNNVAPRRSDL